MSLIDGKNLQIHKMIHTRGKHSCPHCPAILATRATLLAHIKIHLNLEKKFIWDCCGKGFVSKSYLRFHMSTHAKTKKFICDFSGCESVFKFACSLRLHKIRHQSNYRYNPIRIKCEICDKMIVKSQRKIHLRTHVLFHAFECTKCHRSFKQETSLAAHMKNYHERMIVMKAKVKCKICSKEFAGKGQLGSHMNSHIEKPIFQCDICGWERQWYAILLTHMEIHISKLCIMRIRKELVTIYSPFSRRHTVSLRLKRLQIKVQKSSSLEISRGSNS